MRKVAKGTAFVALVCAIVVSLSVLFTPQFADDVRFSVGEMRNQPKDTVEVAAVGASSMYRAFSPDYLYEKFGISAFSYCSANQPTFSSYYLLKRALDTQSTISTVVVDAAPLVKGIDDEDWANAAIKVYSAMEPSMTKLEYISCMAQTYESVDFFELLVPILRFHSRWDELSSREFARVFFPDDLLYLHGQIVDTESFFSNASLDKAGAHSRILNANITDEVDVDDERLRSLWSDINVEYFGKIVELCDERGIDVVLVKTPASNWGNEQHDSVTLLAGQYDVPFVDMSTQEIWDECGLSYDNDFRDTRHANIDGSVKICDYLGEYLLSNYDLDDARENKSMSFMESDAERFNDVLEDAKLRPCATLEEYLDLIDRDRYTVFIATKGESTAAMTDEVRKKLRKLGLSSLADLGVNESYAGIIDGGEVVEEATDPTGALVTIDGVYRDGVVSVEGTNLQPSAKINGSFRVASIGAKEGSGASVTINGGSVGENGHGINITVYNRETGSRLDTSSFDTHVSTARTSDLPSEVS